ncbi:hypothetical protein [Nocardioides nanhaiensis]|uniref:Uncharacterized protein n=1 Tax=Nocardioides nanhaiensis TaxID=1476871 RepID=A0ABP8WD17_9ACTN
MAACAPLTDLARVVSRTAADGVVDRIVMVGGELVIEDDPEFNVGQDPDAAFVDAVSTTE